LQGEFFGKWQQASRHWLDRMAAETKLVSELTGKLTAARSIPDAMTACREFTSRRIEIMMEDTKHLWDDAAKLMQARTKGLGISGSLRYGLVEGMDVRGLSRTHNFPPRWNGGAKPRAIVDLASGLATGSPLLFEMIQFDRVRIQVPLRNPVHAFESILCSLDSAISALCAANIDGPLDAFTRMPSIVAQSLDEADTVGSHGILPVSG
jgi:hypothetical protein